MSVRAKLAHALGRSDEAPNIALAQAVARRQDAGAVGELIDVLDAGHRAEQSDAIKTLYEIGRLSPRLLAPHLATLFQVINSPNNRLAWGALAALDAIVVVRPNDVAKHLPKLVKAFETSSVIGRDKVVSILCQLVANRHAPKAWPHLLRMLGAAPTNQLPMYAEMVSGVVPTTKRKTLREALAKRARGIAQRSKRLRLEKVIRQLSARPG